MGAKKLFLLLVALVAVVAAMFAFLILRPKPAPKADLSAMLFESLASNSLLESNAAFDLNGLPPSITKEQATKIKKYRFGDVQLFLVGRASDFFPYYGPDMSVSAFRALPSGVFASADNGQNWSELVSSDSVANDSRFADIGTLEPVSIFERNQRMFADFATHSGDGSLMRMSSVDGIKWNEYGCYYYVPEKYDDPFALDASARCLQFDAALDDWVPAGLKPAIEVNQSRETLLAYLGALSKGWYEAAATLYGGSDLDMLRYWNPDTKPDNAPTLFAATCSRQTICTWPISVMPSASDREKREYSFDVVLPLGKNAPGLTRKFTYTVKLNSNGKYLVGSLPGYVQ